MVTLMLTFLTRKQCYGLALVLLFFAHTQLYAQRDTVVIYKHCSPTPDGHFLFVNPSVTIDSLIIADTVRAKQPPSPIGGLSSLSHALRYPNLAIRAGIQGKVIIKMRIDEAGDVSYARISNSDAEIFNEPAKSSLQNAKFVPARDTNDHPISITIKIPVRYSLYTEPKVALDITEIALLHDPSIWGGPFYRITLRHDGAATYEGLLNSSDSVGIWEGNWNKQYFEYFEAVFGWFCFFDTTYYPTYESSIGTDIPRDIISVKHGGTITIKVHDRSDERLWAMARLIDWIATRVKWHKVPDAYMKKQ
jgi:TonB family protein